MGNTVITMPPAEVLYRLAKRAKDRAKELDTKGGAVSLNDAEHLNHVGNGYLIANEGREVTK